MTSSPPPQAEPLTHGRVLVVFSGLLLAMLLAALDQTIVATALPTPREPELVPDAPVTGEHHAVTP